MKRNTHQNPPPEWLAVKIVDRGWILGGMGAEQYWSSEDRRRHRIWYWSVSTLMSAAKESIWVTEYKTITAETKEEVLCQIQNLN